MIKPKSVNKSATVPGSQRHLNEKAMEIPALCVALAVIVFLPAAKSADPTCGAPPVIEFASITSQTTDQNPVGTTISYACQFGYVIDGTSRTSSCEITEDGNKAEWTEPQMSCIPRSCGDPGFVSNSQRIGSLFTFPNFVSFECDDGFRLLGNAKRFCRASGKWSGRLPQCQVVFCEPPDNPEHGRATYTSLEFGSELKFECDAGYHLNDQEPVICTSNGTWSPTEPESICVEAACELPQRPEHGSMELLGSNSSPRAGSIVVFSCDGNRIADGPTTSKCLEIGEWTFPSPQCLEPCKIPAVPNGKIGRYVARPDRRTAVFTEIPVGENIADEEKLFLHCNSGYSPLGSENWQERVTCSSGKWSEEPLCEPSACRSDPPQISNGKIETMDSEHGGTISYSCIEDFVEVKAGNVICQFGQWKGETPICQDTRCSTDILDFPGLEKGNKKFYKNGEELQVVCNHRYDMATGHSGRMKCEDRAWKGVMPPCVAASCSGPPPNIIHGKAEVSTLIHSSIARYVCDEPYFVVGSNRVQCLFGEWVGQAPSCEDKRCLLNNLKHSTGVSRDTPAVTNLGDHLQVRCIEGYTPSKEPLPVCVNGEWTRNSASPCVEKDCRARWIQNGCIKERKLGPSKWNWSSFRYVRTPIFEKVPLGFTPSRSADLFLFCNYGFSLQGNGMSSASIHCSHGMWSPDPVCILNGMKYERATSAPQENPQIVRVTRSTSTTVTTSQQQTLRTTTSRTISRTSALSGEYTDPEFEITPTPAQQPTVEDFCSCEFTLNDEKVSAYINGKQLKFNDRISHGSVVKFWCKDVGYHNLVGRREFTCENCQPLPSNEYPKCSDPEMGDAVIVYDNNVNISIDGALEVQKGQTVRLTCIAMEEAEFPEWSIPQELGVNIVSERMERRRDVLYISHLDIMNPDLEHEGLYECAVGENVPTVVEFRVIDPTSRCPEFEDSAELLVTYNMGTQLGSQATFSCRKSDQELTGTSVLTCLRNGEWSSSTPQCTDKRCRELKGTDLMQISYTNDRKLGSFANFHCFAPGRRSGVSRTRCQENGQWADPTPKCTTPPCSSGDLFSVVPQGVVPDIEDVTNDTMPYNSTVRLTCSEDLFLVGNPTAKCGKAGVWEVDDVQCVSGCLPLTRTSDSNLIILPDKDIYTFGESVTFSCPPGLYLNLELQKIMCLRSGWSENKLPECVDSSMLGLDYQVD